MTARLLFMLACAVRLAAWHVRLGLRPRTGTRLVHLASLPEGTRDGRGEALRIARMVNAVAARMPLRITCLTRSVVLVEELRRRGMAADLRIGARVGARGALDAHAWVELDGRPVNDRADIAREYPPLQPAAGGRIRHWT